MTAPPNSSTVPSVTADQTVSPVSQVRLRIALSIIAGVEAWFGLGDFPGAFDLHDAPLSVAQFLINARLAIHPVFAVAAFVLAVAGRIRAAMIVLAAYILVQWLSELPSFARFGIEWNWTPVGLSLFAQQAVFPVLAVAAIILARCDRHLWLGALFVALPPANEILGIAIFTIGILLYGF